MRIFNNLRQRFSRQIKAGFDQRKLSKVTAAVIGTGGLGSITALQLAMLGIKKIKLIDYDDVERSNLNRQFFFEEDIHEKKVVALGNKLGSLNSRIIIETHDTKAEDTEDIWKGTNYVFDCLDNIKTRQFLNRECIKNNVVMIHAGCSDKIGEVQLIVPKKTACMECLGYPEAMKKDKKSCGDFDAAICTTNFITSALQIEMFLNHLFNKSKTSMVNYIKNKKLSFGELKRKEDCKICANKSL